MWKYYEGKKKKKEKSYDKFGCHMSIFLKKILIIMGDE